MNYSNNFLMKSRVGSDEGSKSGVTAFEAESGTARYAIAKSNSLRL